MPADPSLRLGRNEDIEPGIAVAPNGVFWAAATVNEDQRRGILLQGPIPEENNPTSAFANSDIWKSTDGGRTYQWVADPFGLVEGQMGLAGGDTDVAVAGAANSNGAYNVYVASLWATGVPDVPGLIGDIDLAVSQDNGRTWTVDKLAASLPLDDRPWLATDGACIVYLEYHTLPTDATAVNRYNLCDLSDDVAGATLVPISSTRYATLLPRAVSGKSDIYLNDGFGKLAVDASSKSPYRHRIYMPAMDCGKLPLTTEVGRASGDHTECPGKTSVHVLISADNGRHWHLQPVATDDHHELALWATWISTDALGNVYLAWWDRHHVFLNISRDGGKTWSKPKQVDVAPSRTAVLANVAAAGKGVVDVSWFATKRVGDPGRATVMGMPDRHSSAPWVTYVAQSSDGGRSFIQHRVTGVVHRGIVCTSGDDCDLFNGDRDLWEDFGTAISPTNGNVSIAYSDDQPQGDLHHDYIGYVTVAG